ncbi:MAG: ribH [Gammaproteobacteria bacterium]|jgi:6,7-dimethyl-8-ribityllumazine synthase|nr:ribH [Gammaproteobacteria bacterium]
MTNYAIVVSEFNQEITSKLLEGALQRFAEQGIAEKNITVMQVPGAVEIPLAAQRLIKHHNAQAVICLGAVIRGDTDHYDYVCQMVSQGCMQVMLQHDTPVIFGILTTDNEEQALARVGGNHGHKGKDAVDAAIKMVSLCH